MDTLHEITLYCAVIEWSGLDYDVEPSLIVNDTYEQTLLSTAAELLDWIAESKERGDTLPDQLEERILTEEWKALLDTETLSSEDTDTLRWWLADFHDATTVPWVTEYEKEI